MTLAVKHTPVLLPDDALSVRPENAERGRLGNLITSILPMDAETSAMRETTLESL